MRDYSAFRVWAPQSNRVDLVSFDGYRPDSRENRTVEPMRDVGNGWWEADRVALAGERYAYSLDGGPDLPDPRALFQPDGVHAPSEVYDPRSFAWSCEWPGIDVREHVLYELHVGAFAANRSSGQAGTFDSAITRLDALADLGIGAVEVMPVAAFPGERGWGYDGVGLFATHEAYGGPAAFQRFIDAAHSRGIGVILDVVYNHLGPAGNYLGAYGPYFTDSHATPWGPAVNFDADGSGAVREFFVENVRQWLVDFKLDGLRLDAVHALNDTSPEVGGRHILAEISEAVAQMERETGRSLTLIAESDLNDPAMVSPVSTGRDSRGMDAQWADDIHHALHAWISDDTAGYYCDFGSAEAIKQTLEGVFFHDGIMSTFRGKNWGVPVDRESEHYDARAFVAFLQNHDQVGNRAAGDRIHHSISVEQHCAAAALYLLAPTVPMLFMGEEWAASTPFPFFSDHDAELGPLVTKGRTEEFSRMGWTDPVPDPQARSSFESAFLDWGERDRAANSRVWDFYRACIALRQSEPGLQRPSFDSVAVDVLSPNAVLMRRPGLAVLAAKAGGARVSVGSDDVELLVSEGMVRVHDGAVGIADDGVAVFRTVATSFESV